MDQPVPNVSRADVERIVRRDFASADVSNALAIVDECQKCHTGGDSPARVQLAALKLADGDISALRREIEAAKSDYRDRKSTRLNSSHIPLSRMPSSA